MSRSDRLARAEERNPLLASWLRQKEREAAAARIAKRGRRCRNLWLGAAGTTCIVSVSVLTLGFSGSARRIETFPQQANVAAGGSSDSVAGFTRAQEFAETYWPEAAARAQSTAGLFFVAVNKYTSAGAPPPGLRYPWLDVSAGRQVVEPFVSTTLVALPGGVDPSAAASESDGLSIFAWDVGSSGNYRIGKSIDVTFTVPNAWTEVELVEMDAASGTVLRRTKQQLVTKYVRREMRELTSEDLETFLDAMEVTYRVPTSEGQALYGPGYLDAFYFVKQHNELAGGPECDAAHDGLGFLTSHMAMTLAYEKVLQAIHPSVALPYWDYTIEAARVEATGSIGAFYESEVFGDDVLGGFGTEDEGYAITRGRWGRIPVDPKSWPDGASAVTNGYGLIRSPWNQNPSPYVTRCPHMFGADFDKVPTCTFHSEQMAIDSWATFGMQIQYKPHGSMHTVLAGGWGVDYKSTFLSWYGNEQKANAVPLKAFGFQKDMWRYGLLQCPQVAECQAAESAGSGASPCTCKCREFSTWAAEGNKTLESKLNAVNLLSSFKVDSAGRSIVADMLHMFCNLGGEEPMLGDAMSSAAPADPAFWPLHPTADRLWHWRRILGMSDEAWPSGSYVHRPESGTKCVGHDAADLVGYAGLFDAAGAGAGGRGTGADGLGGYTNAELYHLMDPNGQDLPYIYDDFEWPHCAAQGFPLDLFYRTERGSASADARRASSAGNPAVPQSKQEEANLEKKSRVLHT